MRSIETLVRNYPDKTGKELLEMQEQDKIEDQKEFELLHAVKLGLIKDINENGGYYKGRFGTSQLHFWRFFNMNMEEQSGKVYCDVECIYIHFDHLRHKEDNGIIITREIKQLQEFDRFVPQPEERTTKEEWDKVNEYIEKTMDFWK